MHCAGEVSSATARDGGGGRVITTELPPLPRRGAPLALLLLRGGGKTIGAHLGFFSISAERLQEATISFR